jgi:hypothetical protein
MSGIPAQEAYPSEQRQTHAVVFMDQCENSGRRVLVDKDTGKKKIVVGSYASMHYYWKGQKMRALQAGEDPSYIKLMTLEECREAGLCCDEFC